MSQYRYTLSQIAQAVGMVILLMSTPLSAQPTPQEHVHQRGPQVMPFALAKTLHIFKMTEQGGVIRVVAREASDTDQIKHIQQHLQQEAERFQNGNYSDPATLHGADMPGLKELQEGASRLKITYTALPTGAEITFETADLQLLTAVHRWFGAQLSEHGADAKPE
jgi:hypothetical protein